MNSSIVKQKVFTTNQCIYCGEPGETDEHVIPFALGGTIVIHNASCKKCQVITSRFERNPLRDHWEEVRTVLDYPSNRKKLRPKSFLLQVTLNSEEKRELILSKDEAIGLASFLEYPLPAFFNPYGYESGVRVVAHSLVSFGVDPRKLAKKYGIKSFTGFIKHKQGHNFERMVAKIAYCFVVAMWGLDCFDDKFILPAILGAKDDIGFWMGCDPVGRIIPLIGKVAASNAIKIGIWTRIDDMARYIVVRLKFFAASEAPEYIVVVGTLKSDFIIPSVGTV